MDTDRQATELSFEAWIVATSPRAMALARSFLRETHLAEDVVQDCYLRLWKKRHDYDLVNDGVKILLRAVSNACINVKTRRRTWLGFGTTGPEERTIEVEDHAVFEPSAELLGKELAEAVKVAMDHLPEMQRAALELKSLGYSQQEIAEILNIQAGNAGVMIHRARQTLAKWLEPWLKSEGIDG
jgi:RNA polymerase sigma factor (sigma-70 family)